MQRCELAEECCVCDAPWFKCPAILEMYKKDDEREDDDEADD